MKRGEIGFKDEVIDVEDRGLTSQLKLVQQVADHITIGRAVKKRKVRLLDQVLDLLAGGEAIFEVGISDDGAGAPVELQQLASLQDTVTLGPGRSRPADYECSRHAYPPQGCPASGP